MVTSALGSTCRHSCNFEYLTTPAGWRTGQHRSKQPRSPAAFPGVERRHVFPPCGSAGNDHWHFTLVSVREGPNIRLAFNGVRTSWSHGPHRIDGLPSVRFSTSQERSMTQSISRKRSMAYTPPLQRKILHPSRSISIGLATNGIRGNLERCRDRNAGIPSVHGFLVLQRAGTGTWKLYSRLAMLD
jgi:hypothetical protein